LSTLNLFGIIELTKNLLLVWEVAVKLRVCSALLGYSLFYM